MDEQNDFGFGGNNNDDISTANNNTDEQVNDLNTGNPSNNDTVNELDSNNNNNNNVENEESENENNTDENALVVGSIIEVGNNKYTVSDNGDILDSKGNVFKTKDESAEWIDSFDNISDEEVEVDDTTININSIRSLIGVEVLNDNGEVVEFDNSKEGILEYINSVNEINKSNNYEAAINTLYQKYPILNDVINYYVANGNSLNGFNTVPDRSNIVVEEDNEQQQEAIIRTAWLERNQKGDVDGYIQYLKSSGNLYNSAQDELESLIEKDNEYKNEIEEQAEQAEQERFRVQEEYWNTVKSTIDSKTIAGYSIPDRFTINKNGKSFSSTPNDFFNYLYRVDNNGRSAYENDLAKDTPNNRLEDELLRAYLRYTGGNYSDLVNMAINKEKVNILKLKAKQANTSSVKITKPSNKSKELDLGYN